MSGKYLRLNYTWLWILAGGTGWAENWLLRSYGLNTVQRTAVVSGFLPLLVLLVLICVFQENAMQRK
jgi:hypothetical protein